MSDFLIQIKNQLNEYFQKFEKKQRIIFLTSTVFTILALTGIIYYFTRPEYIEIYKNLEPKQTGEILETLEENNIQARIGQTSGSILVSKNDEKRAQIVVATQELPTAKFSFDDAFSGNSFMMTSEERSQRYIYALQNHLSSIIEELDGVKKASVTLVVPESSGFVINDNQSDSKASVMLDLSGSTILNENAINGIAILVSNAVEGLMPENVTIHGSDGSVLNQNLESDSNIFSSNNNMALQQTVKQDLEKSITDFLSSVYGYGNVSVMANVKLNFDSEVTEIREFAPPIEGETTGIPRSLQELEKTVPERIQGGVPGTDTNAEDIPQNVEGDEEYTAYSEASRTINYEINELHKKIVEAQGQVEDVTVAVFLNRVALEEGDLSEEEKEELVDIISAAAGLDTKVVQVGVQEFNNTSDSNGDYASTDDSSDNIPLWIIGILLAGILGATYFVLRRKKKDVESEDLAGEMIIPDPIEEINLDSSGSQTKQQIEKLASKNPEGVAQLLKNWLNED